MRIVCISDAHELHRELVVPEGDLLIHAGDFTFFGKSPQTLRGFNEWLADLPHLNKVVVPCNHESGILIFVTGPPAMGMVRPFGWISGSVKRFEWNHLSIGRNGGCQATTLLLEQLT